MLDDLNALQGGIAKGIGLDFHAANVAVMGVAKEFHPLEGRQTAVLIRQKDIVADVCNHLPEKSVPVMAKSSCPIISPSGGYCEYMAGSNPAAKACSREKIRIGAPLLNLLCVLGSNLVAYCHPQFLTAYYGKCRIGSESHRFFWGEKIPGFSGRGEQNIFWMKMWSEFHKLKERFC
ncbi:hypothetical protein [Bilophila wadsworthia]|uniref:hypothetical protein n=1 Tax=Bilophila wadsworthia TaxID=35833 RepID=UPI001EDA0FBC|nr:hypothetical protein [Bilophila wadsworthia]MCG4632757.1 hypothetical protein [Bilophila wadsworthia]